MRITAPSTRPFMEITAADADPGELARLREVLPNLRREAARGDQRAARIVQHVLTEFPEMR